MIQKYYYKVERSFKEKLYSTLFKQTAFKNYAEKLQWYHIFMVKKSELPYDKFKEQVGMLVKCMLNKEN